MGAASKRAKLVRQNKEFDSARLESRLRMPRDGRTTIDAWSWQDIYNARTEQMIGQFLRPARMAEAMRTDDALFVAHENRLAPQSVIPVTMKSSGGARGDSIASEADALFGANGVGLTAATLKNIHSCLVDHGVAFAAVAATPREDGSRVDLEAHYWPIEYIHWDPVFRVFKARTDPTSVQPGDIPNDPDTSYGYVGGYWLPVIHGDGRWIIFSDYEIEPFRNNACILPAALVWARHAFASRDWARGSKAHGSAKMVGELPSGVPLQRADGTMTDEAAAFVELMRQIINEDSPAGIRPAGSKTEFITNNSTAWQVWAELVTNAEKSAARIYLGTDGTLGSQGGAPGVDIGELFGVAATKVRGDLECISRGINTGLIEPWCAINFGDSKLAPKRQYLVPNSEEQELAEDFAERNDAYFKALVDARNAGLTLTPEYITELASKYRVPAPGLSKPPEPPPPPKHEADPNDVKEGGQATLKKDVSILGGFEEDKHPRAEDGKFGEGSGGAKPESKKEPSKKTSPKPAELVAQMGGASKADSLKSGMREESLAFWRKQYEGKTPAEATAIATSLKEPIKIGIDGKSMHIIDGRHRTLAAKEAGAEQIKAEVRVYRKDGSAKSVWTGNVKL